jgi:hypothetical protein
MAQPPSEHDGELGSVNDFAPERPAVQTRHVDIESVVLWLVDTWRAAERPRRWYIGALGLLIVGGVWGVWLAFQPAAPIETPEEPIPVAVSKAAEPQVPIQPPAIVSASPAIPALDEVVPPETDMRPVKEGRSAPAAARPKRVSERESSAPPAGDVSQVSPLMPRPVAPPTAARPRPPETGAEEPAPAASAPVSEPAEPPTTPQSSERLAIQGAPSAALEDENVAVRDVVGRYRAALAALDAAGVRQVWPSVNHQSLERAFRQLAEQDVFFFSCTVDVDGGSAGAVCVGTTRFVPKIGNRSPQSGPSQWNFKLSKRSAGAWLIDDIEAR